MQYDTRQTAKPPSPVEPTGFFTGVQIRPIIVGVVVDYIATYAGTYAYFFIYLTKELSKQGEVTEEPIRNYMTSPEGLIIGFRHRRPGNSFGRFRCCAQGGKTGNQTRGPGGTLLADLVVHRAVAAGRIGLAAGMVQISVHRSDNSGGRVGWICGGGL